MTARVHWWRLLGSVICFAPYPFIPPRWQPAYVAFLIGFLSPPWFEIVRTKVR